VPFVLIGFYLVVPVGFVPLGSAWIRFTVWLSFRPHTFQTLHLLHPSLDPLLRPSQLSIQDHHADLLLPVQACKERTNERW
jgi:hypothetical protein